MHHVRTGALQTVLAAGGEGMRLPVGLADAWAALGDGETRLDLAITLVFLRQLLDPEAPLIAGHDPRQLVSDAPPWAVIVDSEHRALLLDALAARLNELKGEELLTGGFRALGEPATERAVAGITRWRVGGYDNGGDLLGELLQRVRPRGNGNAAFYTPYHASYLMAALSGPKPGESAYDSSCGSGRMLLAALHACRVAHGGEPELYGCDVDGEAIRACKLNLMLAGYGCNRSSSAPPDPPATRPARRTRPAPARGLSDSSPDQLASASPTTSKQRGLQPQAPTTRTKGTR